MKQAGTMNPLILLDEIDKLGNDFRGDPASALLEVLDGAQNFAFRDHYLEVPYDLSDVMFITTANSLDTIPRPLLDRMEVIQVPSYTAEEKLQIAKRHLLPKQLEEHALSKRVISVQEQALSVIINMNTAEAGVRQLERLIAAVCRKAACEIAQGKKNLRVTPAKVKAYLGAERYKREPLSGKDEIGICNGLAVTGVGGEMLTIEVTVMEGTGQLTLTGQLGDVMQESAKAAVSYIRAHAARYGIEHDFYKTRDIHLHVPAGATPKDGPSAGITIATAIISALTGAPVRGDVAMTGEVTLRGRVLPIGGLKEKLYAAQRAGVSVAILPEANRADAQELPESIKRSLKLVLVETLEQVFETALTYVPAPAQKELPLMKMGQTPPPPQDAYIS
jgi:ATP-dependent Lon protease